MADRECLRLVVAGHVDHGKSTVLGRLLNDSGSLPQGKLEQIRAHCQSNSRPFEYAFLLDAMRDEQAQGITMDAARIHFKTKKRDYLIIDAPGNREFLKNMVSGASQAHAAMLVLDAQEGIQENSKRHGVLLPMLGVQHVAVLINKMDLVGYRQDSYEHLRGPRSVFKTSRVTPTHFIPVSGFHGDNIYASSKRMPWYSGPPLTQAMDEFPNEVRLLSQPFRMPVQDVYKFTENNDTRRIIAGSACRERLKFG